MTVDRGIIAFAWSFKSAGCGDVVVTTDVAGDVSILSGFFSLHASQAKSTCERFCQASSHEC